MIATVRHINAHHVQIRTEPRYEIAVFNVRGEDIEVIVTAEDGSETIRLKVDVPSGQTTSIKWETEEVGVVNIYWRDK